MAFSATATAVPNQPTPRGPLLRSVDAAPSGGDFTSRALEAGVTLSDALRAGRLQVDLASYVVTVDDHVVDLSPRQVELLSLFLASPRKVWSREQLHWICWGDTAPSRRVDVQLCRLRAKTGVDLFRNVRDRGWALRPMS